MPPSPPLPANFPRPPEGKLKRLRTRGFIIIIPFPPLPPFDPCSLGIPFPPAPPEKC